ncbi:GTP-binding protein Rho1 [Physocladia obscura]|uniref:GTP-binding protein Rho1 n=1 Tax=Physocladia obscura TaxID=109957 RepID=A0AAD5T5H6_9FUNG|nr:GTP-binding protein Rho1 [Physocladia obscura]
MSDAVFDLPKVKFVVVGDGFCGKTCLLTVYNNGEFPGVREIYKNFCAFVRTMTYNASTQHNLENKKKDYIPTVFENTTKIIDLDGRHVTLALWDTAGQEDYSRLRPLTYTDSHAILICFSIDSPDSLENVVENWITEVTHFCRNVPVILVGCKKDLRTDPKTVAFLEKNGQEPVLTEQGQSVAAKIRAKYFECSALTGEGVNNVFEYAARVAMAYRYGGVKARPPGTTGASTKPEKCSLL